jgi:hypothetical protein
MFKKFSNFKDIVYKDLNDDSKSKLDDFLKRLGAVKNDILEYQKNLELI